MPDSAASPAFEPMRSDALVDRLAAGESGLAVVTPNRRLAQALERVVDARQAARGLKRWPAPDILPFNALVERLYEDAQYSELGAHLPVRLGAHETQALWERVIASSEAGAALLVPAQTAAACIDAWQTAHAHGFAAALEAHAQGESASEDARAFAGWARDYRRECARRGWTDTACLPELLLPHLGHASLRLPSALVLYAFERITPQQRRLLDAFAARGVAVSECESRAGARADADADTRRLAFASAEEEILAAARWARSRLESSPRASIGIVVPDLGPARKRVRRGFAAVLAPANHLPAAGSEAGRGPMPFNISLGEPLTAYPVVHAALELLALASGAPLAFERASRLIRSPFLPGAEAEFAQRARLDARLRERAGGTIGLGELSRRLARLRSGECARLAALIETLAEFSREHRSGAAAPSEWVRRIDALLRRAGFPGRSPDSAEYQALKSFHAALAALGTLERVLPRMRFGEAVERLRQIAAGTLFQPEAAGEPIQILGVLESAGLAFDHLWVMGLTDEAWPLRARPNPFLPLALQRRAGVPEASPAASLELDRRITAGWLAAAPEVVFSHALREGERELSPSPLILAVPEDGDTPRASPPLAARVLFEARAAEHIDEPAPPAFVPEEPLTGGTSVFRDQAACAFRAFATHRLRARPLEQAEDTLSAADRGTLAHGVLEHAWRELRDHAGLVRARDEGRLADVLQRAAEAAIAHMRNRRSGVIDGRFREIEAERLMTLACEWLTTVDLPRDPFSVEPVEARLDVAFGGVAVSARLDRMDRLADGSLMVIDYKTGAATVKGWLGERPEEPQLPMYALAQAGVAAVAFGRLKSGAMKLDGLGEREGIAPGVQTVEANRATRDAGYAGWDDLVERWRIDLDALGRAFAAGVAAVNPKQGEQTCRLCALHGLCRIAERAGWSTTEGESEPGTDAGGEAEGGGA